MILSIVVPVYNVAQYLSKCLDSILTQDINKDVIEIIVVNDGSTDNSGEIAQEYASRYSNILLINQENQGLSGARNSGIRIAKGKYIQFVDSDDFLEPNVLGRLIEKMERENLDILRFNYQNVNERYEVFEPNKSGKPFVDYRDNVCDGITFLNERLGFGCYAWQFLLRTELVKSVDLFKEGIFFEDTEWTPRILLTAKKVTSVEDVVYNYLAREGSITKSTSEGKKLKIINDKLSLVESLKHQMDCVSDKRWYQGMISSTVISLLGCIANDYFKGRKYYIRKLNEMGVFPISDYHINSLALRKLKIINLSPFLFCLIYKIKNK